MFAGGSFGREVERMRGVGSARNCRIGVGTGGVGMGGAGTGVVGAGAGSGVGKGAGSSSDSVSDLYTDSGMRGTPGGHVNDHSVLA